MIPDEDQIAAETGAAFRETAVETVKSLGFLLLLLLIVFGGFVVAATLLIRRLFS